ncbi:MAG: hypothetical protein ACRDYF_15225 [Acidimicrobiia bacterium]
MLTGRRFNCTIVRQRGSHVIVQCGECRTVVPMHSRDLAPGPGEASSGRLHLASGRSGGNDEAPVQGHRPPGS